MFSARNFRVVCSALSIIFHLGVAQISAQIDVVDVRLSGSWSASEGRVEVQDNDGKWATICSNQWGLLEATVVCRYLGFQYAESASVVSSVPDVGSIGLGQTDDGNVDNTLNGVKCIGNESNLAECWLGGWSKQGCLHEPASVVCSAARHSLGFIEAVGSLRLTGGNLPSEGRVEVYLPDQWGTICDDNWNLRDATVVCRQLGYNSVVSVHTKFGEGFGSILLDDVRCTGEEEELRDCPHAGWGRHDCSHSEDVGVVCSYARINHGHLNQGIHDDGTSYMYRLFGGNSSNEGVLQFRSTINETWNTACLNNPLPDVRRNASSLCRAMGYKVSCKAENLATVEHVVGFSEWFDLDYFPLKTVDSFDCMENECDTVAPVPVKKCTSNETALWLVCDSALELRLDYGVSDREGVLQVRCNSSNDWGGVCGETWMSSEHAHEVTCRHLGFPDVRHITPYTVPGSVLSRSMDFFLGVDCSGHEDNLEDCEVQQLSSNCSNYTSLKCHTEDPNLELMLVDSLYYASGIVVGRVNSSDKWGAICGDHWDSRDVDVACRHLGFLKGTGTKQRTVSQGIGKAKPRSTFLSAVGCHGNESRLWECELVSEIDVPCDELAYVECIAETEEDPVYLCGEKFYCGYHCNQSPGSALRSTNEKSCKCDDACVYFHDCCYDYHNNCDVADELDTVEIQGVSIHYYACIPVPVESKVIGQTSYGFALVSLCPEGTSELLRQSCEQTASPDDVIASLPVFTVEGVTYKNVFCAICHGIEPQNIRKWRVIKVKDDEDSFIVSKGEFWFQQNSSISVRTCPVGTNKTCLEEFVNSSIEAACLDHHALLDLDGIHFDNPHCALCNRLSVKPSATCDGFFKEACSSVSNWEPCMCTFVPSKPDENGDINEGIIAPSNTIEALFYFGWGGDAHSNCQSGQFFDPFLDRCRSVLCVSGTLSPDGECVIDEPPPRVPHPGRLSFLDEACTAFVDASLGPDALYWQAIPAGNRLNATDTIGGSYSLAVIFKSTETMKEMYEMYNDTEFCNITEFTVFVLYGASLLANIESCANYTHLASNFFAFERNDNLSNPDLIVFQMYESGDWRANLTMRISVPKGCVDVLKLNCLGIIQMNKDEFVFQESSESVQHISRGNVFSPGEFAILPDGKAAICDSVDWTDPVETAKGLVSLICCCLSLVGLAFTFITYCVFPELRNMAGIYIMNLVVALFAAVLILNLPSRLGLHGHACVVSGSLTHWFWLSVFFWMATLSCNAAKTFYSRKISQRGSRPNPRKLIATTVAVWGGAFLIPAACLTMDLCNCTDIPSLYSKSQPCLYADGHVSLVVFGAPVAVSLLISTASFVFVIVSVRKSKRDTKMVQKRGEVVEILDEMKIYFKLALLFGITWVLALVSEAVDHVVASFVNITINSLQGFFLFVSFCLNKRVRRLWKKKLTGRGSDERSTQSGQITSTANVSSGTPASISSIDGKLRPGPTPRDETRL